MTSLLNGKAAVITGATSGNGRAIAKKFAKNGANVVIADIRQEPRMGGKPTHELIREETPGDAKFIECDVSNRSNVQAAVDAAEEFGGVDIMVNNAGIRGPTDRLIDISEEDYKNVIEINQHGVVYGSQIAGREMKNKDGGNIINISSVAGIEGYSGSGPYCTSKGAVRLLTYSLASELGPYGIRVNAVHPGVIRTGMTIKDENNIGTDIGEQIKSAVPLRRYGVPEDVANTTLYLASELSSYVTGESIIVDGGVVNTGAHAPSFAGNE